MKEQLQLAQELTPDHMEPDSLADGWEKFSADAVKSIQSGITEVIAHIAYDDAEM